MACGAAIRARSQFCPQCGKPLEKGASDALPSGGRKAAAAEKQRQTGARTDRELKTSPLVPPTHVLGPEPDRSSALSAPSQTGDKMAEGNHARQAKAHREEKPAKGQRVKNAAREMVQENVRPRVEKLRKASNVVLEEAAIDPSLRFILIAVLIFIVFITLLLLSFIK